MTLPMLLKLPSLIGFYFTNLSSGYFIFLINDDTDTRVEKFE